jgi:hypothetical protein
MGIINVPGRVSGRQYPINIAGDVPDEVERGRIAQYIAEQEQTFAKEYTARFGVAPEAPEDDGTAIGRGLERGAASAKTRLGTTQRIIGGQLEESLPFGLGTLLKDYGKSVEEQGNYEQLLAQLSQPAPIEYTDVKGLNSGFSFVGEQLGQTALETGAVIGATTLGTIAGTAATGNPVTGTALGLTAGALTAAPTIFGGNVQRQEEEVKAGRKDKVDLTDALAATVGQATIESITDKLILLKLVKPGQKIFSRTIGGLIEGAALEAPTEILQQVIERAQAGLPLDDDAAIQEYITGGISGAVVGGSIRAPLAMTGIGTGAQPTPSTTPTTPAVNPPALAGPTAPVTQLGVTAQEPQPEDFDNIADYNAALGQYYAGIAATTLTPEAQAAADAVAGAAPTVSTAPIETPDLGAYDLVYNVAAEQYGLDPVDIKTIYETIKAKKNTGRNAAANKIAKEFVTLKTPKNVLDLFNTIDESISKIEQEDANVGKPTVTTGSKSGTTATKPGVGNGIGLDATQGAAKLETPAAPGLGAAVSDTSTDNVPEGSKPAALEEAKIAAEAELRARVEEMRAADRSAKETRIAAAAAQAAAKLEGSQSAALLTPAAEELLAAAVLGAPSSITNNMRRIATENGIEILPTDTPTMVIDKLKAKKQAVESLTAARRAEKVAVDLDAEVAAQAAAKLQDAQLPSMDEEVLDTVEGLGGARAAADARTSGYEKNIDRIVAVREEDRAKQQAADEAQAAKIAAERTQQYGKGDLPLSRVPAEYAPMTGDLGRGEVAPEGADPQVIPASITVLQAPITPEKQVEPVTEKLWKEMGFSNNTSKLFSNIVNGVEQGLKGKPVNDPEVRSRLSKYAYSSEKPNPQQIKVDEWLQKNKVRMQGAPDVRSSAGQAMISRIEATNRGKLDADNLAAQREKDDLFNPEFAELSVEDPYLNDVSTPSDKQKATFVAYGEFKGEAPAEPVMYLTGRVSKDRQGKERAEEKKVIMLPHTAAGKYFERYKRIPDALNAIASDYTGDINAYKTDDQVSPAENTFFVGTGRIPATAARAWVDANMSEAVQKQLSSLISKAKTSYLAASDAVAIDLKTIYEGNVPLRENAKASAAANMKRDDAEVETNAAIANVVKSMSATVVAPRKNRARIPVPEGDPSAALFASANKNKDFVASELQIDKLAKQLLDRIGVIKTGILLPSNAVLDLEGNMHPAVNGGLLTNNLAQALRALGRTGRNSAIRRISTRFSRLVGNTQVQVVEALRGQDGTAAAGVFDPSTNTIYLDSVTGLNPHVVIHEMSHALTSAELANPQSPLRQRVSELFNKALPYMGSIQGSANLDEFAAESMSNHMFREEMARIHPNGNPMSTWQLFSNSVKNFLRRLIGLDPKAYGMLSEIDQVLDAILAPAPQFRDAGQLYMNSLPNGVSPIYRGVFKILNGAPGNLQNNESLVGGLATAFRALTKIPREILIGLTPTPSLLDVARRYGLDEQATNLFNSIGQHDAAMKTILSKIDAANEGLQSWKKANPEAADILSRIMNEATDNGVDPTDTDTSNYDKYWMSYDRLDANSGDIIRTERVKFNTAKERNAGIDAHNGSRVFALQTEARKSGNKNDAKVAKYNQLRADLNAIQGTGAQDIFVQMRDTYKELYDQLRKAIYNKIDASFRNADGTMSADQKDAARKLKNDVYARVFDENLKRPYFPFSREGNFWVKINTKNAEGQPDELIMAFGTPTERDNFVAGIPADGVIRDRINKTSHTILKQRDESGVELKDPTTGQPLLDLKVFEKDKKLAFDNAPSTSFMRQALDLMNKGKVSSEVQADFVELFLSVLPESAVAKAFQKRQGIEGYQSDQFAAFENKAYSLARYGTNVEWGQTIREASNKLEAKKTEGMDEGKDAVIEGLLESARYTLAYRKDGILEQVANTANRMAFTYTVGLLNPSSSLVNTTSLAIVVGPYLAAKHGWVNTTGAISRAVKMFTASGFSREQDMLVGLAGKKTKKLKALPSYMNYYTYSPGGELILRDDLNLSPAQRADLEEARYVVAVGDVNGFFSRSLMHDSLGLEGRTKGKNWWDTANVVSASAFQLVERMTREASLVATYRLELSKLANDTSMTTQQKQAAAAKEAMDVVMKTSGGSIRAMSPKYFRKHIGRIAGMFKTYGMTQAYLQFSLLRDVLVKSDLSPRDRKLAAKRFAAVHLSSLFLAGVAGTPFFGAAAMMWDAFFTDDDEDDAETITRKYLGELAYKGFPTEFMGVDISARIGLNLKDLLFQLGRYNVDMSDEEIMVQVLGGPAWGTFKNIKRGMTEMADPAGDPQRAIEAMVPASIRNALKAYRYGTEGAKTRRGDPVVDDITGGMLLGQAMGFAPTEYTFAQEKAAHVKGMDDAIRTKRSKLMKRYWIAYRQGDFETVGEIQQEIDEFNARHAGRPKVWIEPRDIQASAKANERTNARAYNGVILSAATADDMRANAEEFGQGLRLFDK